MEVIPAAVVFDLDGTLVLTEVRNLQVWDTFLTSYGIRLDDTLVRRLTGRRAGDSLRDLAGILPVRAHTEYVAELAAIDAALPLGIEPVPGAMALVQRLITAGVPLGLVTSARTPHAQQALAALELSNSFAAIVTADDVAVGKPDPEGYLLACRRLGVDPRSAVGVEDSQTGVAAIKAAGMHCVGVTTTTSRAALAAADLVVENFLDPAELGWPVLAADPAAP